MTLGQPQAEPQDRLIKCLRSASFRDSADPSILGRQRAPRGLAGRWVTDYTCRSTRMGCKTGVSMHQRSIIALLGCAAAAVAAVAPADATVYNVNRTIG